MTSSETPTSCEKPGARRKTRRETKDQAKALRLGLGAEMCEAPAAFIYWRDQQREAA